MIDRNYILNLVKSRDVTIQEFNYDKLTAPPINYFFNDFDLNRLYEIASSLRYSGKPQIKYQEIDKIMKPKGFVKLSAGTNRVVYRHLEIDSIVAKIAADDTGLNDNPREFINQQYLKPFCAKTFEVSRNGAVAISERVNPITNREEFLSVAEDIFTLIHDFIIGEYVMDDIGTKFFMNYGLRRGFGPVLLDYVFQYKLDGNKLFCCKEDKNNPPTLKCLGEIDYDPGYNTLYCKKCGREYRAHELEEKIGKRTIITRPNYNKGEHKMKVTISGGSKGYNVTTTINTENINTPEEQVVWTSNEKTHKKELHVSLKDALKKAEPKVEIKTSNNKVAPEVKKAEEVVESSVNGVHNEPVITAEQAAESGKAYDESAKAAIVAEDIKPNEESIAKKLTTPFKIKTEEEKKTPVEVVKEEIYNACKDISGAELSGNADEAFIASLISDIKYLIDTSRSLKNWTKDSELALFNAVINDEDVFMTTDAIVTEDNRAVAETKVVRYNQEHNTELVYMQSDSTRINEVLEDVEVAKAEEEDPAEAAQDNIYKVDNEVEYSESTDGEEEYYEYEDYADGPHELTGVATFTGKIIDISSKFPDYTSKNVLVIEDATGEYLTIGETGDKLLVVDRINGLDTSEATVVSKVFLDNVMKAVDEKAVDSDQVEAEVKANGVS